LKIKNNFLSGIFNIFDFPIRFIYCRFSLNKLFFWKFYSSDFNKLDKKFEEMKIFLKKNKFNFKNKICLELGPGNSYLNAYNFLLLGAKKVILVDKYPRYITTEKQKEYFLKEIEFIKKKYKKKNLFFIKNSEIDPNFIEFIPKGLTEIKKEIKVDFVYSISVFEHIKDVEKNIKKLGQIVKKNGLMYHSIDMRDHYNFNKPFLFYKYSKNTWEKYLTKLGVSYTNRIRYSKFKKLFEKYGFETIYEETKKFDLKKYKISKEFDLNDKSLNIGVTKILLKIKITSKE